MSDLLAFPPEDFDSEVPSLTKEEIFIVRKMIAEYKSKNLLHQEQDFEVSSNNASSKLFSGASPLDNQASCLFCDEPPAVDKQNSISALFSPETEAKSEDLLGLLDSCKELEPVEAENIRDLRAIVEKIDGSIIKIVIAAILGLFPCKKFIRHGTPEQKLFALKFLGDRFLEAVSGLKFPERRNLVKMVAKHLSDISENHNFISMEGEPFKPSFHERVSGSSSTGLTIKEMRGFVVAAKGSNRIVYTGLVLL